MKPADGGPRAVALIATLAMLAVGRASADDGPGPLRWKLEAGRELAYTLTQETAHESKPEGAPPVRSHRRQEVDLRWIVESVGRDAAEVALVVERIRIRVTRDGLSGEFAFDTAVDDVPAGDPYASRLAALLEAVVGARVAFSLTPRGEVRDVKMPDEMLAALRRVGAAEAAAVTSEEGVRNLIVQAVPALPDGPSGPGTTWTRQAAAPMPLVGSLILDKVYTDRGPRPGRPEVHDVDFETRFTLRQTPGSALEAEILGQSGGGSFAFDASRGLIESGRLEDSITARFEADGRKVEQSITTRLRWELKPAAATPPR